MSDRRFNFMRAVAAVIAAAVLANCSSSVSSTAGTATSAPSAPASGATGQTNAAAPSSAVASEGARIGANPANLLSRVSDGVTYEIYPGAFRGSWATLADNTGNDVDKSLLLRDLIHAAMPGAQVRFAACTLDAQTQDRLIAAAAAAYRAPKISAQNGTASTAKLTSKAQTLVQHGALVWAGLLAEARDQQARLQTALQTAGAPLTRNGLDLHPIVANHVWLQLQDGGTWTDLDATLPHAKPGAGLCAAASTTDDLPDADYDTLHAVVRVERRQNGSLDDRTAVEGTWRTAQLGDTSLTFAFAEPAELTAAKAPDVNGAVGFTPVLRAGDAIIAGQPVYVPILPKQSSAGAAVGNAASAAAQAFGGASATATPSPVPFAGPEVVGTWLALTVNAPNVKPETVQSEIFDRASFADRANGTVATAKLSPLDDGEGHYLPFGALFNVAVNQGTGVVGVGARGTLSLKDAGTPSIVAQIGAAQRGYYAMRRALFAGISNGASSLWNAQPGISVLGVTWRPKTVLTTDITPVLLMDVASDHASPSGSDAAAPSALAVASLLSERLTTDGKRMLAAAAAGRDIAQVQSRDVLAVFDAAKKANVSTSLVRSSGDINAGLAPDAKARLSSSLESGAIAFAPAAAVNLGGIDDYGWWLVGPDGNLRDEMQDGRHEMEEYGETVEDVPVKAAPQVRRTGAVVSCAVWAVTVMMTVFGGEGAFEGGEQQAEVIHALYEEKEAEEKIEEAAKDGEACE